MERTEEGGSLGRGGLRWENGSLVGSILFACWVGVSSIEDRIAFLRASLSDTQSCGAVRNCSALTL